MMKSRSKWCIGLFLVLATAFLCFSATVQAADKKEIVVGTPLPMTGILSMEASEQKWAYEQAIKDVNAKGGVFVKQYKKKLPVRLVVADAESDPGKAAAALERLVKVNKVDVLLSTFTTNLSLPTCVAADKLKKYYHVTTLFPELWRPQKFQWSTLYFFSVVEGAEVPFKVLDTIPAADKPKNIALMMEDTTDGRGLGGALQEGAKKYKYEIALVENMAVGAKDYSSQILKLKSKNIDGVIMFSASQDAITFVRQMKEAGLNLKYFHGYKGTWTTDFANALGKDAQYVVADGFWSEDFPYPGSKELGERYYKQFKKRSVSIGLYYAICQTLFTAIENAGTLDGAKIRQAVLTTQFKGTTMGDIKYNPDGTAIFQLGAFQWWDGQLKTIYPFDMSKGYKVKVAPPWDKR
jgi:branched-chain amino acid transport system substrate-binding protein